MLDLIVDLAVTVGLGLLIWEARDKPLEDLADWGIGIIAAGVFVAHAIGAVSTIVSFFGA